MPEKENKHVVTTKYVLQTLVIFQKQLILF